MMERISRFLLLQFLVSFVSFSGNTQQENTIQQWLTDPVNAIFFKQQPTQLFGTIKAANTDPVISIDNAIRFQSMDGFGFALTGGSASNIIKLKPNERASLLRELFATDKNNIGISYLRLSIGASDLNKFVFSYDDMPEDEKDEELHHFNLGPDKKDVIPVLKEILAINPTIKILASPWSPPVWMKNNNSTRGGNLQPAYYQVYAKYFVKYILAMRKNGIRIDAITVQNEPLHPGNNPSLFMEAKEQAFFVRHYLGPAFQDAMLTTKIIIYDHNADKPEYPISILNDPDTRKYIDGSAFHLYAGNIEALSQVHEAHPDKNIYFTEQWIGAPGNFAKDIPYHIENLIIGASRHWSKTVIEWNLAADENQKPHTDKGGCTSCLGAITISKNKIIRNPAYYIIAHAAKFVRPGSIRIASNMVVGLPNVAFITPNGKNALIVLNNSTATRVFNIVSKNKQQSCQLAAGAVATFIW